MKANKILKEIESSKEWIEMNKKFVNSLSRNKILDHNTGIERSMNENEMELKSTWIINNLIEQTNQYHYIIEKTKLLFNLF